VALGGTDQLLDGRGTIAAYLVRVRVWLGTPILMVVLV
jgi:hypothetical protein